MTYLGELLVGEGRKEGLNQGIRAMVLDNLAERRTPEEICNKLVRFFGLKQEEADKYFEEFSQKN